MPSAAEGEKGSENTEECRRLPGFLMAKIFNKKIEKNA